MIRALFRIGILALVFLLPASGHAEPIGDPVAGESVYRQCKACHLIGDGAKHRIGPHLNGIFGRQAGTHEDFRYSKSLVDAGKSGLEWHADTLDTFIKTPRALATGTRMSFKGISDETDRGNLIAYLREFSDQPSDYPGSDPTAVVSESMLDPSILAIVGDKEYGEYLSSECMTCHQSSGDQGIPSIINWPEDVFVEVMHAYKNKHRANPVMQLVAGRMGNDEIAALAAYFSTIEE